MTVVVVVRRPVGEAEQRSAGQRRGMGRAQQVEEARVGDRLPSTIGSLDLDPAPPQLRPGLAVRAPQAVETVLRAQGGDPSGLLVRAGVRQVRHDRGDQAEAVASIASRPELVRRREPAAIVARRHDRSRRPRRPANDVVYAMPSVAMSPPECHRSRPSTPSLGPWSCGWAWSSPKPGTPVGSTPADELAGRRPHRPRPSTSTAARPGTDRAQKAVVSTDGRRSAER